MQLSKDDWHFSYQMQPDDCFQGLKNSHWTKIVPLCSPNNTVYLIHKVPTTTTRSVNPLQLNWTKHVQTWDKQEMWAKRGKKRKSPPRWLKKGSGVEANFPWLTPALYCEDCGGVDRWGLTLAHLWRPSTPRSWARLRSQLHIFHYNPTLS